MACMSRYNHAITEGLLQVIHALPDNKKRRALQLCGDGLAASKQNITSARHTLEMAAKTLTTSIAPQRHSWLRATNLQLDTRGVIEDLPFDGFGLFHGTTDSSLQEIDKTIKMSPSNNSNLAHHIHVHGHGTLSHLSRWIDHGRITQLLTPDPYSIKKPSSNSLLSLS